MLGLESGDRLTVSGGEPLQQAEDLYRVLWAVRPLVRDIILFSGYTPEEIRKLSIWASRCCQLTDLVVAGRYDRTKRRTDKPLCGSDNQELCFNPLGALRLSDLADVPTYEIDLDGSGAYVMTGFLPGGGTE
jgi:anaerobic ribonucleoside-triphosphate reductase activating protein